MLLNPSKDPPDRFKLPHSRMLGEGFPPNQLYQTVLKDPIDPSRLWTLQCFYMPVKTRSIQGVRAKLIDQKGFVTFCNQRDLELMLGYAKPGTWCGWLGASYPEFASKEFYGFHMDYEDCADDLHDREMQSREDIRTGVLQVQDGVFEVIRYLHLEARVDVEQHDQFYFMYDYHPGTGMTPDLDVQRIDQRWRRVVRSSVAWHRM